MILLRFAVPLVTLGLAAALAAADAAPARFTSRIIRFADLAVKPSGVGERRDVANNPTATLERLECHISVLNPSKASHLPHTHPQEELIVLLEGTLDVNANGQIRRVGPGSLFFFRSNNPHAVQNNGGQPARYYVFNFETARTHTPPAVGAPTAPGELGSTVVDWNTLPVKSTATGERRAVFDSPTATLENLECHVTTLKAGAAAHAPHRHPDEEIILIRDGQLDVTINGVTSQAGSGDILFFSSNDEHGVKNSGATPATYYVLRLVTAATPKPA